MTNYFEDLSGWVFAAVSIALYSLVVQLLWLWFVVPLGVIEISYWHAIGLTVLVGVMLPLHIIVKSTVPITKFIVDIIALPVIALLIGWGAHHMMAIT